MEINEKTDRACYIAACSVLIVCILLYFLVRMAGVTLSDKLPPCYFHAITGYDCPGCGGTRAVIALLHGKILQSFRYHPIVPYTAAIAGWFILSQTIERISAGRLRIGMRFRNIYLWIALAIVVLNFLLRNFMCVSAG